MARKRIRIILDSNWWISLAIMHFQNKLVLLISNPDFQFISCDELEIELKKILAEKRIQKYLSTEIKKVFWYNYFEIVEYHKIKSSVIVSRDKKDNYLLALAKDARVDFLITGDKDLLILKQFENTTILTLTEFINHLNKK